MRFQHLICQGYLYFSDDKSEANIDKTVGT